MGKVDLQPVTRADEAELVAAHQASTGLHHPWTHPFTDAAGFAKYIGEVEAGEKLALVARETDTGSVAGLLELSQIARGSFQNACLGIHAMEGYGGRGLMTEAVRRVLDHAFGELGLHRVEANVQPGNARSLALVARVRFRREGFSPRYLSIGGVWRDHERWAILSDEWPSPTSGSASKARSASG